ncbi:ubiquitin-conjugating enzyme/RWD-like protein [Russula brevipes]|nr:ubiquitin-conjugating enzyme/RWD-like protein [Russula brevipes]
MSDARLRRVNKEIADCKNDKSSNINIDLIDNSPFHLRGSFEGPQDTPYQGGHFEVDIAIPDSYPFQPVKMKFLTKVYHPNISSASGAICLDILKDAWSPPRANDPQDAEVAKHYMTSRTSFEDTARYWTHVYAGGPVPASGQGAAGKTGVAPAMRAHVDQFEAFGFEHRRIRRLNYRGANVAKVPDDKVVEELLKA